MFRLKTALIAVLSLAVTSSMLIAADEKPAAQQKETPRQRRGRGNRSAAAEGEMRWRLGIQLYDFNHFTFVEAIEKSKEVGVRVVEGFSWQKISKDTGDAKLDFSATEEQIAVAKKALEAANIRLVSYYVGDKDFGKDEAASRKVFDFAKKMEIQQFVCEPNPEYLETLDKLAQETQIRIAIHNHPKHPNDDKYTNWNPDNVLKMIEPRSKMIGCCADTGHWIRSGLDPVECLKKYEGRLFSLHLKDVHEKGPAGHDVVFGTGIGNLEGQLKELARQKFSGLIALEYEHNMDNNVPDLKQSAEVYRKIARELGVRGGRPGGRNGG